MTMRVRLSYTVDQEDVLKEAAKLIGLSGSDLQHAVEMFQAIQKELNPPEADDHPNVGKALEMIDEMREALVNVDTRLGEVTEIVKGYEEYNVIQRNTRDNPLAATPPAGEGDAG